MSTVLKAAVCITIGAVGIAPFTRPDQAAFEREVSKELGHLQARHLRDGALLRWALFEGADLARTSRFEEGLLYSSYQVLVAGHEVARCAGVLGVVACRSTYAS